MELSEAEKWKLILERRDAWYAMYTNQVDEFDVWLDVMTARRSVFDGWNYFEDRAMAEDEWQVMERLAHPMSKSY